MSIGCVVIYVFRQDELLPPWVALSAGCAWTGWKYRTQLGRRDFSTQWHYWTIFNIITCNHLPRQYIMRYMPRDHWCLSSSTWTSCMKGEYCFNRKESSAQWQFEHYNNVTWNTYQKAGCLARWHWCEFGMVDFRWRSSCIISSVI